MITLVNYGAGNIRSVANSLDALGAPFQTTSDPIAVQTATKIILPGVGHFGQMMRSLEELDLRRALVAKIRSATPFLGICGGLQCLFEGSEESPESEGLRIFKGSIRRFTGVDRVPHMGWNLLEQLRPSRLLCGLDAQPYTYFAHSYYAPVTPATAARCTYGQTYSAILEHANIYAVQFHPEKSGDVGLQEVRNFLEV